MYIFKRIYTLVIYISVYVGVYNFLYSKSLLSVDLCASVVQLKRESSRVAVTGAGEGPLQ